MLKTHAKPAIVSANPLALATLTTRSKERQDRLVEWTSVRRVKWKSNGRRYVRHVLEPILEDHVGLLVGTEPRLTRYDVGCRLVVDVSVECQPGNSDPDVDVHVEG